MGSGFIRWRSGRDIFDPVEQVQRPGFQQVGSLVEREHRFEMRANARADAAIAADRLEGAFEFAQAFGCILLHEGPLAVAMADEVLGPLDPRQGALQPGGGCRFVGSHHVVEELFEHALVLAVEPAGQIPRAFRRDGGAARVHPAEVVEQRRAGGNRATADLTHREQACCGAGAGDKCTRVDLAAVTTPAVNASTHRVHGVDTTAIRFDLDLDLVVLVVAEALVDQLDAALHRDGFDRCGIQDARRVRFKDPRHERGAAVRPGHHRGGGHRVHGAVHGVFSCCPVGYCKPG